MTLKQNEKVSIIGVAAVIVVLLGVWLIAKNGKVLAPTNPNNQQTNNSQKPPVIYSMNGTVKIISKPVYTLTLPDGKTLKSFTVPATVEVVRRVTTSTGVSLKPAKLTDVKVGSQIVMYTKEDPTKIDAPQVVKVEIIK